MTQPGEEAALDLTGDWVGSFNYPRTLPPVVFRATLDDDGGCLVGATVEPGRATRGGAGLMLTATLQGRRDGRAVRFLKTYDAVTRNLDAVRYEGQLSPDGSEIDGRWTIVGAWSGEFVMVRRGFPYAATARRAADKIGAR